MIATHYLPRIKRLPKGLSYREGAMRLGLNYQQSRRLMIMAGYESADGRSYSQKSKRRFVPERADWSKSNIALARRYGVSRNLVRMWRDRLGHPKVEARGRPRNNHRPRRALQPS